MRNGNILTTELLLLLAAMTIIVVAMVSTMTKTFDDAIKESSKKYLDADPANNFRCSCGRNVQGL